MLFFKLQRINKANNLHMGKVRLSEIAKLSGVSESTVSRILSGDTSRKVRAETVRNVLAAADELGWASSRTESVRRFRRHVNIGIIFISDHESIASDFFQGVVKGVEEEASILSGKGENLSLSQLSADDDNYDSSLAAFDAAIILGRGSKERIDSIVSVVPSVVYAGLNSTEGMDEVLCDSREGIKEAVGILYGMGRRKIAFIGPVGSGKRLFNEHRYNGYLEGLDEVGIGRSSAIAEDCFLMPQDGYEAARRLLSVAMPDAIIVANDNTAIGVIRLLKERGIRVPDDIAVTGFDNIASSAFLEPSLSTFDVPKAALGRFALRVLLDRVENHSSYIVRMTIPYTVIERESTGGGV